MLSLKKMFTKEADPDVDPDVVADEDEGSGAETKPPFRARFQAWWNGYDLKPGDWSAPEKKVAAKPGGASDDDAPADEIAARKSAFKEEALAAAAYEKPKSLWHENRRKLVQLVWGEGFIWPGGTKMVTELSQPLGLDSSSSMIEVGAGMGGGTREVAGATGAYITAWDFDQELAEEGTVQAEVFSLEKKASVHHLDLGDYALKPNFYGGAIIRESLYRVEDKEALLKSVVGAMKHDAQIVVWDLFFESTDGATIEEWISHEGEPVFPWGVDAARQCLVDASIDVRVTTDDTEKYCELALNAWNNFVSEITADPVSEDMVIPMVREVERWASRIAAMESGELRVYRLSGVKREKAT